MTPFGGRVWLADSDASVEYVAHASRNRMVKIASLSVLDDNATLAGDVAPVR